MILIIYILFFTFIELIFCKSNNNEDLFSIKKIIFPFYEFSSHQQPLNYTNLKIIKNEMDYYEEMKKISIFHLTGSTVLSFIGISGKLIGFSFFPLFTLPVSIPYTLYHLYIYGKSSHLENKYNFLLNIDKYDYRYIEEKLESNWLIIRILTTQEFYMAILCSLITWKFFSSIENILLSLKNNYNLIDVFKSIDFMMLYKTIVVIIIFSFLISFIQTYNQLKRRDIIQRNLIKRELRWSCNAYRVDYGKLMIKNMESISLDNDGYFVGDEKCNRLEMELYSKKTTLLDVALNTLTKPIFRLIGDVYYSINWIDKTLIFLVIMVLFYNKYKLF